MKSASKAVLEMQGDVDTLGRIMDMVVKMSNHGLTGHGFSVKACDGKAIEKELGYWDGHGADGVHRVKLTESKTGATAESVLCRSIEPDGDDGHNFEWVKKLSE